jgi:CRISPR-associated protein Cas2
MRVLITYDVNTTSPDGERRLRRVARACVDFGQRVQQSVFECTLTEAQMEKLRQRLLGEINVTLDSLRIYRLPEAVESIREIHGVFRDVDFTGPLVL